MKIEHHVAASIIISGILYAIFKSWGMAVSSFITGIFIDVDHIIDYLPVRSSQFNIKHFLQFFYEERHQKIILILHGWEWLIVLGIASKLTHLNPWIVGIFFGCGQHLVFDVILNATPFWSYSLLWRWKHGFDSEAIFPKDRKKTKKI